LRRCRRTGCSVRAHDMKDKAGAKPGTTTTHGT
jgi:hypothetical protein